MMKIGQASTILVHIFVVGALPDMVKLTHDCRKIIVAIEGEVRSFAGKVIDPEGGVGIIEFDTVDLSGNFQFRVADFKSYNARCVENESVTAYFTM